MSDTIATVGDLTSHGGKILTGSPTRKLNGKMVARVGDKCSCPTHGSTFILTVVGCGRPKTDGRNTAHSGAITACGAKILISPNCKDVEGNV